eukprot:4458279-Pyramimonas_sp.AAC.1
MGVQMQGQPLRGPLMRGDRQHRLPALDHALGRPGGVAGPARCLGRRGRANAAPANLGPLARTAGRPVAHLDEDRLAAHLGHRVRVRLRR